MKGVEATIPFRPQCLLLGGCCCRIGVDLLSVLALLFAGFLSDFLSFSSVILVSYLCSVLGCVSALWRFGGFWLLGHGCFVLLGRARSLFSRCRAV